MIHWMGDLALILLENAFFKKSQGLVLSIRERAEYGLASVFLCYHSGSRASVSCFMVASKSS